MFTSILTRFAASCPDPTFFGLKPWYYYLPRNSASDPVEPCGIKQFNVIATNGSSDFTLILLAVVDDLLIAIALVAVGFIIYGGYLYLTSQGSPDQTQKAQGTITNAVIGVVIAMIGIAVVRFLGTRLG